MEEPNALISIQEICTWYERRAKLNRNAFVLCKIIQLLCSAAIPLMSVVAGAETLRFRIAILGSLTGLLEALVLLGQFQPHWLQYRATREAFRQEDLLHRGKAGPYRNVLDPDVLFVERISRLMSSDVTKWLATRKLMSKPTNTTVRGKS